MYGYILFSDITNDIWYFGKLIDNIDKNSYRINYVKNMFEMNSKLENYVDLFGNEVVFSG